jgi:hypothetical protein
MKFLLISVLICFPFFFARGQQGWPMVIVNEVKLSENSVVAGDGFEKSSDFSIGGERIKIWGWADQNVAVYPKEMLTAFFVRTIQFNDVIPEDGTFEWIFTGSKGGITIKVSRGEVLLTQRYYDSFGFNEVDIEKKTIKVNRYPQKNIIETKTTYSGRLSTISVESNANLLVKLKVNDELIVQLPCLFDLTRHQLKYTGKGIIAGAIFQPQKGEKVHVSINPERKFQEILGFGGILSPSAYWTLNKAGKEKWWKLIKEYNLLLQREYPASAQLKADFSNWDDPAYLVPHYYGDNFPNGELTDFEYVKKIRAMGGINIFEFWNLPGFMYENGKLNCQKYAEAIVNYCKTSVKKTGQAPEIVGIQNEVTQTPETWRDLTISLRQQLDANGFKNVKIHSHNPGILKDGISAVKSFQQYPGVWEKLDFAASNLYDYQSSIFSPDEYDKRIADFNSLVGDKPFISTEICINAQFLQTDAYKISFSYAMLYHKNMAQLNAIAIMYCWTLLDYTQPSFAASRTLFTLDHSNDMQPVASGFQLRTFGAFSRHIREGMKRVEVLQESAPLLVTAYADKKSKTVVVLNPTIRPVAFDILWDKGKFKGMERTSLYHSNQKSTVPETIVIEPGEILTFY